MTSNTGDESRQGSPLALATTRLSRANQSRTSRKRARAAAPGRVPTHSLGRDPLPLPQRVAISALPERNGAATADLGTLSSDDGTNAERTLFRTARGTRAAVAFVARVS